MLCNSDKALAEAPNLSEHIFQAIGGLLLQLCFGKKIMQLLQKQDPAESVSLTLAQTVQMNPTQKDIAQEHSQRFGQFLVKFDDDGLIE